MFRGGLFAFPAPFIKSLIIMKRNYTNEELEKMLHSNNPYDRKICAKQGYKLEELKDDESEWVRLAVARQGKFLEELKDDDDVRSAARRKLHELKQQEKN